jgi:predicted NBD/HSP70 family sugar kinase
MYILADIGGTKMRIARSNDLLSFDQPIVIETPQRYEDGLQRLVDSALSLAQGKTIEAMAVGFPGVLSHDKRSILSSEHLQGWAGHMFQSDIERAALTSVSLENDTALVGLGEAVYGAGRHGSIVAYITISTGVNGVRIVDSAIDRTSLGFEIGGQYLTIDDKLSTLEELVSGSAIHEKYGMHPRELGINSPVWEELAPIVAIGIHNTILHWSPDTVIFGGSMMNEIGISVESVTGHVQRIMKKFPNIPSIVHSSLHDEGGLYGGMARLR